MTPSCLGCEDALMATSTKARLRDDLTTAMRARDELRTATLRMVLSAVKSAEVAGDTARELSEDEVLAMLRTEAKKRREAAEAFGSGGRGGNLLGDQGGQLVVRHLRRQVAGDHALLGQLPLRRLDAAAAGQTGMGAMGAVMG